MLELGGHYTAVIRRTLFQILKYVGIRRTLYYCNKAETFSGSKMCWNKADTVLYQKKCPPYYSRIVSALFQQILTLKIVSALIQQSAKKCPPYYSSQQKSVRLIPTSCLSALLLSALVRFPSEKSRNGAHQHIL